MGELLAAAFFMEVGLGYVDGCIQDGPICSSSPVGMVSVGLEQNGFILQAEHTSSIRDRDYGLNSISLRYRLKP